METQTTQQSYPTQKPNPSAGQLRKQLEKSKADQEKLTQKNTSSSDYVTKAEKAENDVAKALDEYKKNYDKLLLAKRDADRTNECENEEATSEIGDNKANVDAAISEVDQKIAELRTSIETLAKKKNDCEQKLSAAQEALAKKQAGFQDALSYQSDLTAKLKAVADLETKIKKVNDHTHPVEFYFYTADARTLLNNIEVKTPDEFTTYLTDALKALEQVVADAIDAKANLIDTSVDLDGTQKRLADWEKNRDAKILEKIKQYDSPAPQPSATPPAAASAR